MDNSGFRAIMVSVLNDSLPPRYIVSLFNFKPERYLLFGSQVSGFTLLAKFKLHCTALRLLGVHSLSPQGTIITHPQYYHSYIVTSLPSYHTTYTRTKIIAHHSSPLL